MALSADSAALIAAMELLRRQISDSALGAAANTQRNEGDLLRQAADALKFISNDRSSGKGQPERTSSIKTGVNDSAIGSVLASVASKFAAIIGPAALLAQVLQAPIAGFGVLSRALSVLASSIAPVLTPLVVTLSAALLALSDVVNEQLADSFEAFAGFVFDTALPAIVTFIQGLTEAVAKLNEWSEALIGNKSSDELAGDAFRVSLGTIIPGGDKLVDLFSELTGGGSIQDGLRAGGDTTGAQRKVDSGLSDTLRSLRNSIGPRASIGSVEGISRQVQLAALSADPLEARLMKQQLDALNRIERALKRGKNSRERAYDPPGTGDFSGDQGSGSDGNGSVEENF